MKTRYRIERVGNIFNKRDVLVLQILRFPNPYEDVQPSMITDGYWDDAAVEDLQLLKEQE